MSDIIKNILDDLTGIFTATDSVLNDWTSEGNLQFPALLGMMAIKLNWDDKQVREADPLVRYYVRKHPDWYVTRGAHGGIMRTASKQKKDAEKLAKVSVKNDLKAQIEAKVAAATVVASTDSEDSE